MKTAEVLAFCALAGFVGFTEGARRVFFALDGAESDGAFGYRWNNPHLRRVHHLLVGLEVLAAVLFVVMLVTR